MQERGLYFPDQWDEHFTPILASRRPRRDAAQGGPAGGAARQRATSSTPGWRGSASFPRACPAPTGCSPTSSRWANDLRDRAPDERSDGRAARRRPGSAPGAASTCSCSAGSCTWWCCWSCSRRSSHEPRSTAWCCSARSSASPPTASGARGHGGPQHLPAGQRDHRLGHDRPLGHGHAGERHHVPLDPGPGLPERPRLRPELLRRAAGADHHLPRCSCRCTGGSNVYTAYEFLGRRFDAKTRLLGAGLFLLQRGLAAGITIYAPAIILSTVLGWRLD